MFAKKPILQPRSVFDFHVHYLNDPAMDRDFLEFAERWRMPFGVSCLGPEGAMLAYPTAEECRRSNDLVLRLKESYPDLVHGFCYVNPVHGRQAVEEVRRCVRDGSMVGVKLWVAVKCNNPRTFPIIEEAIDLGVPVLQHSYLRREEVLPEESKPDEIAELARLYPTATIIMAHIALRWREGTDSVRDCPNILVDTGGFDTEMGSIEYAVERLGAERVLYGSDAPGRDILYQLGKVMAARVSEADRQKILRGNAERLLMKGRG